MTEHIRQKEKAGQHTGPSSRFDIWMDMLSCWLLCAGALLALYRVMPVSPSFPWAFLALPAVLVPLVTALTRRWWLPIWLFVLFLAGGVLFLALSGRASEFSEWMGAFLRWWLLDYMPDGVFGWPVYLFVYGVVALAAVSLFWLFIRVLSSVAMMTLLCAFMVMFLAMVGFPENAAALGLMGAGLIPLTARAAVERQSIPAGKQAVSSAAAQLIALPLAAVCLLTSLALPADTSALRVGSLGDAWNSFFSRLGGPFSGAHGPITTDFSAAYRDKLGGPVHPGSAKVMEVQANQPYLLKGSVLDKYTGHGWVYSDTGTGRRSPVDSGDMGNLSPYFGGILRLWMNPALSSYIQGARVRITLLHPFDQTLYYFGIPQNLSSLVPAKEMPGAFYEYGLQLLSMPDSELYFAGQPDANSVYQLDAYRLNQEAPDFDDAAASVVASSGDGNWGSYAQFDAPTTEDTSLPAGKQGSVDMSAAMARLTEVARGITGDEQNPYLAAVKLSGWLKSGFTYTTSPDVPPENQEFVSHFLDTKQGYCAYYATALAVMARCIGIPSRYVTGFALVPDDSGQAGRYMATESTAHAWTELYFDGIGWLTFDPTGGQINATASSVRSSSSVPSSAVSSAPVLSAPAFSAPRVSAQKPDAQGLIGYAILLLIALLLIALLLFLFGRRVRALRGGFTVDALRARGREDSEILQALLRDIRAQLALLGVSRRGPETLPRFARRASEQLELDEALTRAVALAACALWYGETPPGAGELEAAQRLHTELERGLRAKLGRFGYFANRVLALGEGQNQDSGAGDQGSGGEG